MWTKKSGKIALSLKQIWSRKKSKVLQLNHHKEEILHIDDELKKHYEKINKSLF